MTSRTTPPDLSDPRVARRSRRARGGPLGDGWWPWLFIVPLLAGVALFYIWPIVRTFALSFTEVGDFGRGTEWVGGENYAALFSGSELMAAIRNTVVYTSIVILGVPTSVLLAALVNRPGLRFATFYRVLYFLPYVAMPTAIALVWRLIYNGEFGILNYLLSLVGIDGPHWVSTPGYALVAVGVLGFWSSLGFSMIILSAGLKNIPAELYEAAAIDGASHARQFRSITVPLLTPSIFFVLIINVIGGFQLFDLLYALMGQSNPALAQTRSLVYLFYSEAFVHNNRGYAAAVAMVILVIIGAVTAVQFRLQRKWVNYA